METLNLNYTNVCWYCGAVYKSNRRTSKYCCKQHNSLYALYGAMIKPIILADGKVCDYDFFLRSIYEHEMTNNPKEWGMGYLKKTIRNEFYYEGPLPIGEEILVVGKYVIKKTCKGDYNGSRTFFCQTILVIN